MGKIDIDNSWCTFDFKILIDFSITEIHIKYNMNDSFCFLKFDFRKHDFEYAEGFGSCKIHPFQNWWKNSDWGIKWEEMSE